MNGAGLIWAGSALVGLWGLAHLAVTTRVVAGFPPLSESNRRVLVMEWVVEGLTLVFVGLLAAAMPWRATVGSVPLAAFVVRACAVLLLVLAGWSRLTGARGGPLPMRVCPLVKTAAAALLWVGTTA